MVLSNVQKKSISLHASAARTATGNGTLEVNVAEYTQGAFYLKVSAASGTSPTLDVKIQEYDDLSASWFDTGTAFTQATGTTTERKTITSLLGSRVRIVYTIGGTSPSFTFTVGGVLTAS